MSPSQRLEEIRVGRGLGRWNGVETKKDVIRGAKKCISLSDVIYVLLFEVELNYGSHV